MIKKLYRQLARNSEWIQLSNGLKIIFKSVPLNTTSVFLQVNTGSIFESGHWGAGLSHFFEHCLFLGSEKFKNADAFSFQIESYGGSNLNAYTTYDHTAYYFDVLPKCLPSALADFSNFVFAPRFPAKAVKNEIGTIVSEMDMQKDNVHSSFYQFCNQLAFETLPYRFPIIGRREALLRLSRNELLQYYHKKYTPNNMILAVVGDFHSSPIYLEIKKATEKTLRQHWGKPPMKPIAKITFPRERPYERHGKVITETTHPQATHPRMTFMWQSVKMDELKDAAAFELLAAVLTDNDHSILMKSLKKQKKLVQNISAHSWVTPEMGQFRLEVDLSSRDQMDGNAPNLRKHLAKIETEIFKVLDRVQNEDWSSTLLQAAKRSALNHTIATQENGQETASGLSYSLAHFGDLRFDQKFLQCLMDVSKKDIAHLIRRFLKRDNFKLALLLPPHLKPSLKPNSKSSTESISTIMPMAVHKPIHDSGEKMEIVFNEHHPNEGRKIIIGNDRLNFTAIFKNSSQFLIQKFLNQKFLNKKFGLKETFAKNQRRNSPSALSVLNADTDNAPTFLHRNMSGLPRVALVLLIKGGFFYETPSATKGKKEGRKKSQILNGSFYLLSKMLKTATKNHSAEQLDDLLAKNGIEITPFVGSQYFGFKLYFLSDKLREAAMLFEEVLFTPHFTPTNLAEKKRDMLFKLESKKENPWSVADEHFKKHFYRSTPFKNDSLGTPKTIEAISLRHLRDLLHDSMQTQNLTLSIYGEVSLADAKKHFLTPLTNRLRSGIAPKTSTKITLPNLPSSLKPLPQNPDHKVKAISTTHLNQSYLQIGYRGVSERDEDEAAFEVFKSSLSGMGGPLFKMRSEMFEDKNGVKGGRCYQLGCQYTSNVFYGTFMVFAAFRRGAEDEYRWLLNSFAKLLKNRHGKIISDPEHKRAKNTLIGSHLRRSENIFYRITSEALDLLQKRDPHYLQKHLHRIQKMDRDEHQKIIQKYFLEDRFFALQLVNDGKAKK